MLRTNPGDVFRIPLSEHEFAFGRVVLDIGKQCFAPGNLNPGGFLELFKTQVLLEVYRETSSGDLPTTRTVLIPGMLTGHAFIDKGLWKVLTNVPVAPEDVSFPQAFGSKSFSEAAIFEGEIETSFEMDMEEVMKIQISPSNIGAVTVAETILYQLGRKHEIKHPGLTDVEIRNLGRYDLRFSEHRDRIYGLAGFDPNESYYDRSKRIGFDLARFYE